ncbi:MAG: 2-amino-4-hydroxy-6-hydroxymethyldihydropteridine diphosphokinase, partial [Gemmatimonadetes bacterium]|nr:2-amino-4-hydroxy-6-hydroxymethyldihydropteridine diphosphokinase [Gemmatimonadota bacterium]
NLGDRLENLRFGLRRLRNVVDGLQCSSVYETIPVGVEGQPSFLNACCTGRTRLLPRQLLAEFKDAERAAGRRHGVRYGPRQLDLDLLLYGDVVMSDPVLVVPHPRLHERAFVIVPLAEIAADWVVPDSMSDRGGEVGELAGGIDHSGVVRTNLWLGDTWQD